MVENEIRNRVIIEIVLREHMCQKILIKLILR